MSMSEKKFYEYTVGMTCATTYMTGSFLTGLTAGALTYVPSPAAIAQGTSAGNRIGNKIYLHQIICRINMVPNASAVNGSGCTMRYGIYHNKECLGVVIAGNGGLFNSDAINAVRYIPKKPQVSLLRDYNYTGIVTGTDSTGVPKAVAPRSVITMSCYPKKRIDYINNNNSIADILKDDWGWFMCCDTSAAMTMGLQVQLIFSDV